jgi:2-amino-4-ketopentanoate thiolase alpha subunit
MPDAQRCRVDDWVEVERVLLEPTERSANLPAETAEKPLVSWVKGFAKSEASLGDELTVETMTGRLVTGRLSEIGPGYYHTFGAPIPELVHIGRDLRARLAEFHGGGE